MLTRLKIAVFAPMPSASEMIARMVKAGCLRSWRIPKRYVAEQRFHADWMRYPQGLDSNFIAKRQCTPN